MRYDKTVKDGYITAISVGNEASEAEGSITAAEYGTISALIENRPIPSADFGYRLRADTLTWEQYGLPQDIAYTEAELLQKTNSELEEILYSLGITASMNKANMVRLILAAQGGETE